MTTTKTKPSLPPVARTASGMRVAGYSLADPAVAHRVAALTERMTASHEASVEALKRIGVLNRSGKLSKNFGGR